MTQGYHGGCNLLSFTQSWGKLDDRSATQRLQSGKRHGWNL